jgi:Na+-driven multidrug efflux pump
VRIHHMVMRPTLANVREDARQVSAIAGPAILTNLATPVANAFFISVIARFGDKAVAATAIIDRIVPVAFGILFALSGAIGPILGQNWGAGRFDRMRRALTDAVIFAGVCVFTAWAALALFRNEIAQVFSATGLTAELVVFFCLISGPMWLFIGMLFVANAAFNNLGFPLWSTLFSWGRATLGTVPMAAIGAWLGGPKGAIIGLAAGSVIFGIVSLIFAYRAIARLELAAVAAGLPDEYPVSQAPVSQALVPQVPAADLAQPKHVSGTTP